MIGKEQGGRKMGFVNAGLSHPKQDIINRLRRIEGQVKGIQRMIEEEKGCVDILTQIAAVRSAVNKVGCMILESHSNTCIENAINAENKEDALKDLINTVQKFLKFID
jgi:DNA-binding FrmR family transcriptional regulator